MPPSRALAEAGVVAISSATLVAALLLASWPEEPIWYVEYIAGNVSVALLIAIITVLGLVAETVGAGSKLHALQRQAGSSGLALGALALPWTFAGLAMQQQTHGKHPAAVAAMIMAYAAAAASCCSIGGLLIWEQARAINQQAYPARGQAARRLPGKVVELLTRMRLPNLLLRQQAATVAAVALLSFLGMRYRLALLAGLLIAATAGAPYCLLRMLPRVFTLGEAVVASQAAALLGMAAVQQLLRITDTEGSTDAEPYRRFVVLLAAGSVLAACTTIGLLLRWRPALCGMDVQPQMRSRRSSSSSTPYGAMNSKLWAVAACTTVAIAAAAALPAAGWAIRFAVATRRRTLLCGWWAANLAAALPAQHWINSSGRVPPILVRKGYHLLAVSLFLPALLLEPQLLAVALAAAFALMLALEVLRLSGLPVVAPKLHAFMTSFTDGRDSGLLLITHFTLLLGMAAPIWLSNALDGGTEGAAGSSTQHAVWPPAYAGIFVIGLGDTAASAVGSLLGRRPLCRGSKKTVEGTAAAAGATMLGWGLLAVVQAAAAAGGGKAWLGSLPLGWWGWIGLCVATVLSCLLEATTLQLDNIFVPLQYFALLCLL